MKILIVSSIKPHAGSASGITEYTYQLVTHLKPLLSKKDRITELYAIKESKYNNFLGLVGVNTIFKKKIGQIPENSFDIIHITDHEIGFVAKKLKTTNTKAKIITTVHDLSRFEANLHRGAMQVIYNRLVRSSIKDAIMYSDLILCNSSQTYSTIRKRFPHVQNIKIIPHGIDDAFFKIKKIKKCNKSDYQTKSKKKIIIGYLGSFAYHKNVISLLKIANLIKDDPKYEFHIYGTGTESSNLFKFAKQNKLNNVKFFGSALQKDKVKIFDSFDIFIFPSLYEGVGYPILEATTRKLPVIVYKDSKIPLEIKKYCICSTSLTHTIKLIKHLQKDPTILKKIKTRASHINKLTWKVLAFRTLKTYKAMIKL